MFVRVYDVSVWSRFFNQSPIVQQTTIDRITNANSSNIRILPSGSYNPPSVTTSGVTIDINKWQHIALIRENKNYRFYIDGSRVANFTSAAPASGKWFDLSEYSTLIGSVGRGTQTIDRPSRFYVQGFRISKIARYSGASFTPLTKMFELD